MPLCRSRLNNQRGTFWGIYSLQNHLDNLRLGDFLAAAEAMGDVAIIAKVDKALQTMEKRVIVVVQIMIVDNHCIELVAGLETAHTTEETAGRLGGEPEDLGEREERAVVVLLIMHLADLNGVDHHAEDAEIMSTADITAQTYRHTLLDEGADGGQAGGDIEVRRGAMGHHDTIALHQLQLLASGPYAMGHDGRRLTEEAITVIGIAIAGALALEGMNPLYLGHVLGEMRLHGQLVLGGQIATGLQHLGGTRGYEARGDDGTNQR